MKTIIILITTIFIAGSAIAQSGKNELPEVGKAMPEFHLDDVHYYSKKKVSLSDFKGKWFILDFWNQYCGVCLRSQPKMDALQKEFKGKVQVLLVGYTGSQYTHISNDKSIRKLYERNRIENKLSLAIAYDSILMTRYKIRPTPYLIIVDTSGIVRAITTGIQPKALADLMENKTVALRKAYQDGQSDIAKKEMLKN